MRLRLATCLVLAVTFSACSDEEDDIKPLLNNEGMSESEKNIKFQKSLEVAKQGKDTEPSSVQLKEFVDSPSAKKPVIDAGTQVAAAEQPAKEPVAEEPKKPPENPLVTGWKNAQEGDFVTVRCVADVTMFGNQVVRTVDLKMAVIDASADSVKIAVDAATTEERPKSRAKNKKAAQKKIQKKDSFEISIARAPAAKVPEVPSPLSKAKDDALKVGNAKVDASCSSSSESGGPTSERCVSKDPSSLYFTNGVIRLSSAQKSKDTDHANKCDVLAFGRMKAPPASKRAAATEWAFAERGDSHFREQVLSAAAGVVEVQFDRLSSAKKADKDTVTFASAKYKVGVRDTRNVPFLDWALQRAMPEFPPALSGE